MMIEAVMDENLLVTKIKAPPVKPELVQRARLYALLDEGLAHKLILVSAPAGYGKTSLVSAWAHEIGSVGWLSLDDGDNDPARFLTYFVAAINHASPSLEMENLPVPGAIQAAQIQTVAVPLINRIALNQDICTLVLDDYHLIDNGIIHEFMMFLLENAPPNLHLILLTRSDPTMPISRLRARGELVEIRASDLSFTFDEIGVFLRSSTQHPLKEEQVKVIQSKTEGWVAGLLLASLAVGRANDIDAFIESFSGSHEYIADYLTDEVLTGQPEHVNLFLLQTSILDRMTGALCRTITGRQDSQSILEKLERENLFVVSLDSDRRWYRYHSLFSDLLRQRLYHTQPESVPEYHRRASRWFEQNNMGSMAIDHALEAGDFELAARIIEREAAPVFKRGEIVTFLNWVTSLPDDLIARYPDLCVYECIARLFCGHPLHVVLARILPLDAASRSDGRILTIHALLAVYQGRVADAIDLAGRALGELPDEQALVSGLAIWCLNVGHILRGDDSGEKQLFDRVIDQSTATGNTMMAVLALYGSAKLRLREGNLYFAHDLYQRSLDLATYPHGRLYIAGQPLIGLGGLYYEWNDLDKAVCYLDEGIELAQQWGTAAIIDGYFPLACIRQLQGDEKGANEAMRQAQEIARRFDVTELDDYLVGFYQARLWMLQGHFQSVQRWLESNIQVRDRVGSEINRFLTAYTDLLRAWLLVVSGESLEALQLLDTLPPTVERHSSLVECHIFQAMAYRRLYRKDEALVTLERALALAKPGNYIRTFLDKGVLVHDLLLDAKACHIFPDYVDNLLAAITPSKPLQDSLVEPLSEREMEILKLIGAGKSNRQIASELVIAMGTVKAHASNIYGKLGVSNRAQAALKARELDLF
ncbi:MAG: hypothetical protein JXA42_06660 [Anaerolineales bacterium]|nr:hypothetical protein [Anaerolineales bacterium]